MIGWECRDESKMLTVGEFYHKLANTTATIASLRDPTPQKGTSIGNHRPSAELGGLLLVDYDGRRRIRTLLRQLFHRSD
jgi:hypothetical protein